MKPIVSWSWSCLAAVASAACGGGSVDLGDTPTVAGQIQGWTGGSGYSLQASVNGTLAGMGPISATGQFSITLAGESTVGTALTADPFDNFGMSCTGAISVTPATGTAGQASFQAITQGTTSPITLQLATGPVPTSGAIDVQLGNYVFVSQSLAAAGTVQCGVPGVRSSTTTASLTLLPGWNTVVTVETGDLAMNNTGTVNQDLRSIPFPAGMMWLVSQ